MGDLLNFKPDRKLAFDSDRPLQFDPRRPLAFDSDRELGFNQNRDLGFGRRGVVFRGYVCPICGSLVTETATRCTECGAMFEGPPRASMPPAVGSERDAPKASPAKPPARTGGASSSVYCAYCGMNLKRADLFCWNCGARTLGSTDVVRLPQQKQPKVTRDWKDDREG